MIPQGYPLMIEDEKERRWVVVGWRDYNPVLKPVVLPAGEPYGDDSTDGARPLPADAGHYVVVTL